MGVNNKENMNSSPFVHRHFLQKLALAFVAGPFRYAVGDFHHSITSAPGSGAERDGVELCIPLAVEYVRGGLEVLWYFPVFELEGSWVGEHGITPFVKERRATLVARNLGVRVG